MRRDVDHHHRQRTVGHARRSRINLEQNGGIQEVALASALDAPDPRWLPDLIDDWESDAEVLQQYAEIPATTERSSGPQRCARLNRSRKAHGPWPSSSQTLRAKSNPTGRRLPEGEALPRVDRSHHA